MRVFILALVAAVTLGALMGISLDPNFGSIPIDYFSYTILPGDNLWSLAAANATTLPPGEAVAQITKINHLDTASVLQTGDQLLIPAYQIRTMNTNPQLLEPVFTHLQKDSSNLTVRAPGMSFRKDSALHCPFYHHEDSRATNSHTSEDGASIRRHRECPHCGGHFATVETTLSLVKKRSGVTEPFSRDKVVTRVTKATQRRPVTDSQLALLTQGVKETSRQKDATIVNAEDVGKATPEPLKALDEAAYLRPASVYSDFSALEDFETAIASLKHHR